MLKLVDPAKDTVAGTWKFQDGKLVSDATYCGRIQIPYYPPEEYDIKIVAELKSNTAGFYLGMAVGENQFGADIDAIPLGDVRTRLYVVNGKTVGVPGAEYVGKLFAKDKPSTIMYRVRQNKVEIAVDGKKVIDCTLDYKNVSCFPDWKLPDKKAMAIGTAGAVYAVHQATLTPIKGTGKKSR